MTASTRRSITSRFGHVASLVLIATAFTGCVGTGGPASPSGSAGPNEQTSPASSAAGSTTSFYLRAWQTQALAPQATFASLAPVTISDGQFIDSNIAVPALFPGPIYVGPQSRPISDAGIAAVVAEARADGLLGDKSDFSGPMIPGSMTTHVEIRVDGTTYELTGSAPEGVSTGAVTPGTNAAYGRFWNQIMSINSWLSSDLGLAEAYTPTNLGVLVTPPTDAPAGIAPTEKPWPLKSVLATFGKEFAGAVNRCGVVDGADAATLLAVVAASNQLTRFKDAAGTIVSIQVRAILPGESGPCD